jgi:hypothetical protein
MSEPYRATDATRRDATAKARQSGAVPCRPRARAPANWATRDNQAGQGQGGNADGRRRGRKAPRRGPPKDRQQISTTATATPPHGHAPPTLFSLCPPPLGRGADELERANHRPRPRDPKRQSKALLRLADVGVPDELLLLLKGSSLSRRKQQQQQRAACVEAKGCSPRHDAAVFSFLICSCLASKYTLHEHSISNAVHHHLLPSRSKMHQGTKAKPGHKFKGGSI